MKIYIEVTRDKYELPLRIADSVQELARLSGTSENNIYSQISHYEHGAQKSARFYKIEVGEDEDIVLGNQ